MRRVAVLATVVVFLLAGLAGLGRIHPRVDAQDATPPATAQHPVVGVWLWTKAAGDPIPTTYEIFHADGTYLEVTTGVGTGVGVWRAVGERGVEVTSVYQDTDPDPTAFAPGTITGRQSLELDEAGTTLTGTYTVDVDGTVVGFELPVRATRLEHESMEPFGTPTS